MPSEMGPTTASFARFLFGFVCRKHLNQYYLQTQSQELGAETVVDTDMLYGMGIVSFQYILSRNLRNWPLREGRTRALRSEIRNGRRAATRLRSAGLIQPGKSQVSTAHSSDNLAVFPFPPELSTSIFASLVINPFSRWSTAEGFTHILKAWIDQLATMGEDVKIEVVQLWTSYLRKIKMGFEKDGRFTPAHYNMFYRERWNEMGGPPRLMEMMKLGKARFKRRLSEAEREEEQEEEIGDKTLEDSIKARKLRRKKRRMFFASQTSDADASAGSESEAVSEADFSESGYLTDATDLSMVEERMPQPAEKGKFREDLIPVPNLDSAPPRLSVTNLVALLTLAVVCRPNSALSLSDLCRLLNSEQITWKSLPTLLPSTFQTTAKDISLLTFMPRRLELDASRLGRFTFRMASFLGTSKASPTTSLILPIFSSSSMAEELLTRVLTDLSLPKELAPELMAVFSPLSTTSQWLAVEPYLLTKTSDSGKMLYTNPSSSKRNVESINTTEKHIEWYLKAVPSAMTRILAFITISLKYLCGLDDQTEVILQHNAALLERVRLPSSPQPFCFVTWLRLSKLRISHIASMCPDFRLQYLSVLPSQGLPPLTMPSLSSSLKRRDLTSNIATVPGPIHNFTTSKLLTPFNSLLAPMAIAVTEDAAVTEPSLQPLSHLTRVFSQKEGVPPRVVDAMRRLQRFEDSTLKTQVEEDDDTSGGLDEEPVKFKNNATASISKFADLRGRDRRDVTRWRRTGKLSGINGCRKTGLFREMNSEKKEKLMEDIREADTLGEQMFSSTNKSKYLEISDETRLSAKVGEIEFESRAAYLQSLYRTHWATERSNVRAPRPTGNKIKCPTRRNYWFHHPSDYHTGYYDRAFARPSRRFKSESSAKFGPKVGSYGRDPGSSQRLFDTLPAHYSWTLNYFASYAHLDPIDLHREVADLERLLLVIDRNFFGMRKIVHLEMPEAIERRERERKIKSRQAEEMAKEEEREAKRKIARAAATRIKKRQWFVEQSARDQGWWSYKKARAGEKCGLCEACWTAGENGEEPGARQCLGLTYVPTAPTSPIRCLACEHCTAKGCGKCSLCKSGENNKDIGNGKRCIWARHCVKNCGVCKVCRRKKEFGGNTLRSDLICQVKGKLKEQEVKVSDEDSVFKQLLECGGLIGCNNRKGKKETATSMEEIRENQINSEPHSQLMLNDLKGDRETKLDMWKRLAGENLMMQTTSFPTTEEVFMKAHYLCTVKVCRERSQQVVLFRKDAEGKVSCTAERQRNKTKKSEFLIARKITEEVSVQFMRKAHLLHMARHAVRGQMGKKWYRAGAPTTSKEKTVKRHDCNLCDYSSTSKVFLFL